MSWMACWIWKKIFKKKQRQVIYLAQIISPTVCFLCSSTKEQKMASKRSMKEDTVEDLAKINQAKTEKDFWKN